MPIDLNLKGKVAIITGDEKVGLRSDRIITSQLEEVIKDFQPDIIGIRAMTFYRKFFHDEISQSLFHILGWNHTPFY